MPIYHWTDELTETEVTTMRPIAERDTPPSDQEIVEAGLNPATVRLIRRPAAPNVQRVSYLDGRKREEFTRQRLVNKIESGIRDAPPAEAAKLKEEANAVRAIPKEKFK